MDPTRSKLDPGLHTVGSILVMNFAEKKVFITKWAFGIYRIWMKFNKKKVLLFILNMRFLLSHPAMIPRAYCFQVYST